MVCKLQPLFLSLPVDGDRRNYIIRFKSPISSSFFSLYFEQTNEMYDLSVVQADRRWLSCVCFLPVRFIRLRDNLPKGRREEKNSKKEKKKKRWRENREKEEVKDSREKEFIETYITTLKDRGESYGGPEGQN